MNAGRELDALIHEKVLGRDMRNPTGWKYPMGMPDYSTDITAAWQVVEHFDTCEVQRMYQTHRPGQPPFFWVAGLSKHDPEMDGEAEAATAPLAICLAALAAVGVTVAA